MRAHEFLTEGEGLRGTSRSGPNGDFESAHPGLVTPAGRGDLYIGRYYDFYRIASLAGMDPKDLDEKMSSSRNILARDRFDQPLFLFENQFAERWFADKYPKVQLKQLM